MGSEREEVEKMIYAGFEKIIAPKLTASINKDELGSLITAGLKELKIPEPKVTQVHHDLEELKGCPNCSPQLENYTRDRIAQYVIANRPNSSSAVMPATLAEGGIFG